MCFKKKFNKKRVLTKKRIFIFFSINCVLFLHCLALPTKKKSKNKMALRIKMAETPEEFEQIERLNYETFVEEIPQHGQNQDKRLIDKFHEKNQYLIAVLDNEVLGMVALNDKRPFSLDHKIANLDDFLPPHEKVVEVRLLAVQKSVRGGKILQQLLRALVEWDKGKGFDIAIISGTTRQQKLYKKMGFMPFHPVIGSEAAAFVPMVLIVKQFLEQQKHLVS
jgi:predicted N-acetyltransferase YhbS